jgi:A/G-specific adenine glycosylase
MKFSDKIINWYEANKRNLPWRVTSDPYKIWLSEIILQQTRVGQGISYYQKFEQTYPDVKSLASANEQDILKLWQGLGYYSRARNLHKAAKIIAMEYDGKFPQTYTDIKALPGVGDYTAAAISSIAFNQVYPVIDGNVIRVISRNFGVKRIISSKTGKKEITTIAHRLIDTDDPGTYNQALMEFGTLYCKPQNPECDKCIFCDNCFAYKNRMVDQLPLKVKPIKRKKRYFHYLILKIRKNNKTYTLLNKRLEKDIWQSLYDFPLIEKDKRIASHNMKEILKSEFYPDINLNLKNTFEYKHILTHQQIFARFYVAELKENNADVLWIEKLRKKYVLINIDSFSNYPIPRLIEKFIKEADIF